MKQKRYISSAKQEKHWRELFLCLSDWLDGAPLKNIKPQIQKAYDNVFYKGGGRKIYNDAIIADSEEFAIPKVETLMEVLLS